MTFPVISGPLKPNTRNHRPAHNWRVVRITLSVVADEKNAPNVTILHNPRCSKSRAALAAADDAGVTAEVTKYLDEPLSYDDLTDLLSVLEDAPSTLVRRDALFKELGLGPADVETSEQVAQLLTKYPKLMERPVLRAGDVAVIGRPTERAEKFLRDHSS